MCLNLRQYWLHVLHVHCLSCKFEFISYSIFSLFISIIILILHACNNSFFSVSLSICTYFCPYAAKIPLWVSMKAHLFSSRLILFSKYFNIFDLFID